MRTRGLAPVLVARETVRLVCVSDESVLRGPPAAASGRLLIVLLLITSVEGHPRGHGDQWKYQLWLGER